MADVRNSVSIGHDVTLETTFSESNLPLLCELARLCEQVIVPLLPDQTRRWSLEDRVLAYLLPSLHDDVVRFYAGVGPGLVNLFNAGGKVAVAHLDSEAVRLLLAVVEREAPQLHGQLVRQ